MSLQPEATPGVIFGIDASSANKAVDWPLVAKTCDFGWEKVTQGTNYLNPYWSQSYTALKHLSTTSNFVPGAYLFLQQGNAAAQVDFFHAKAGDLTGFLIAVDAEPWEAGNSHPTQSDLNDAVRQMRHYYPQNQIVGYCPKWYWGSQPLVQFDWLWASEYVNGTGTPEALYAHVPASWWDSYGGRPVEMLQYTSSAVVPGVGGAVDCSAFRGTPEQLKKLILKPVVKPPVDPPPVQVPVGDEMYTFVGLDLPKGHGVVVPVPTGAKQIVLLADPGVSGGVAPSIRVATSPTWKEERLSPTWVADGVMALPAGTTKVTLSRGDDGHSPITVTFN